MIDLWVQQALIALLWYRKERILVSSIAGGSFTNWATREALEHRSGQPIPSPGYLPIPEFGPGSPTLQADSLPAELPGKTKQT